MAHRGKRTHSARLLHRHGCFPFTNCHAERIHGTGIITGHAALFLSHLSSISEAVPVKYMHLKSRNPFMPHKTIQSPVRFLKKDDIA